MIEVSPFCLSSELSPSITIHVTTNWPYSSKIYNKLSVATLVLSNYKCKENKLSSIAPVSVDMYAFNEFTIVIYLLVQAEVCLIKQITIAKEIKRARIFGEPINKLLYW